MFAAPQASAPRPKPEWRALSWRTWNWGESGHAGCMVGTAVLDPEPNSMSCAAAEIQRSAETGSARNFQPMEALYRPRNSGAALLLHSLESQSGHIFSSVPIKSPRGLPSPFAASHYRLLANG